MRPRFGDAAQKAAWLPRLARGEIVGCFGLTEPEAGSDPASLQTRARRVESGYLLTGSKTWITHAPIADLFVVWAWTEDERRALVAVAAAVGRETHANALPEPYASMGAWRN